MACAEATNAIRAINGEIGSDEFVSNGTVCEISSGFRQRLQCKKYV